MAESVRMIEALAGILVNQIVLIELTVLMRRGEVPDASRIGELLYARAESLSGVGNRARDEYEADSGTMQDDLYYAVVAAAMLKYSHDAIQAQINMLTFEIERGVDHGGT